MIAALKDDAKGVSLNRYEKEALATKLAELDGKRNTLSNELSTLELRKRFLESYVAEFKQKVGDEAYRRVIRRRAVPGARVRASDKEGQVVHIVQELSDTIPPDEVAQASRHRWGICLWG